MAHATDTTRTPAGHGGKACNRRILLGRAAAAAPAVALAGVPALAGPADPHPAWLAEYEAARATMNAPGYPDIDSERDPVWRRFVELEDLIAGTPARTPEGAGVQLALAAQLVATFFTECPTGDNIDAALRNALAVFGPPAGRA